jgi:hypothetical protein
MASKLNTHDKTTRKLGEAEGLRGMAQGYR